MIKPATDIKLKDRKLRDRWDFDSADIQVVRRPFVYTGPQKPRSANPVSVDQYDLPANYNTTRITLLCRDPHWLHAYWEISPASLDEMRSRIGSEFDRATYTLRMYEVSCIDFNGHNANHTFDMDFAPHTTCWYVNLWSDNVSYCAEIGVRTRDGRFFAFARSNFVTTPRASSSGRSDMIWMDVRENKAQPFIYTTSRYRRVEKALKGAHIPVRVKDNGARKILLSDDDVRSYYSNLFPMLRKIRPGRNKKTAVSQKPVDRIKDHKPENIMIPGLSRTEFYKKFLLGSSAEMVEKGGASESLTSSASESLVNQKGRKFFFELWTELIVHGRTEPDATVKHGEKVVGLRPDGTFTLRFALPDGKIPLDFVAISHDQIDQRRITTAVERFRTIHSP